MVISYPVSGPFSQSLGSCDQRIVADRISNRLLITSKLPSDVSGPLQGPVIDIPKDKNNTLSHWDVKSEEKKTKQNK